MMRLRQFFSAPRVGFAAGFLLCLLLLAAVIAISIVQDSREATNARATALGAVASSGLGEAVGWQPVSFWKQSSLATTMNDAVGGVPEGLREASMPVVPDSSDRRIVRAARLSLLAKDPLQVAEAASRLAPQFGGYVANIQISEEDGTRLASLVLRVPTGEFERAREALRKLGSRVEDESIEAQDMTKQYVDFEAALRNYRAEEAQYLEILRRATAVRDVLAVSEKLAEVRGRMDRTEGEFRYLTQQITLASFAVSARADTEGQWLGVRWRPAYNLRHAFRTGLQAVARWADAVVVLLMRLPAIALWLGTALAMIKYGWKLARWWWAGLAVRPAELED